jgi:hypothetical protein
MANARSGCRRSSPQWTTSFGKNRLMLASYVPEGGAPAFPAAF